MKTEDTEQKECTHGVLFDEELVKNSTMSSREIKTKYPRLHGKCPLGCGYEGIAYASYAHYLYGDW